MAKKYTNNKSEIFLDSLKNIYKNRLPTIEKGLRTNKPTTFRLNTSKANIAEIKETLQRDGFTVKETSVANAYILLPGKKSNTKVHISETEPFISGKIYIQELASQLPPLILEVGAEDKILDMASAPGSKTTQMADLTNGESEIVALEKHPIRIKTLQHNVNIQNFENIKVILGNGIKFDKRNPQYIEYFDKILVDAPCSSEGTFNLNDPKTYKFWRISKRKDMSKIQKGLIMSGIRMLKPKGTLVYSTCTFGTEENEEVLDWLLNKMPELKIEKIDLDKSGIKIQNTLSGLTKIQKQETEKDLNKQIANSIRILPNENFGGFFIAKIFKP